MPALVAHYVAILAEVFERSATQTKAHQSIVCSQNAVGAAEVALDDATAACVRWKFLIQTVRSFQYSLT